MKIHFCTKDAGRNPLITAISGILTQDEVYNGISVLTHAAGGYIVKCTTRQNTRKGAVHVNIRFSVTSGGRKAFAKAVGEILGCEVVYNGVPSFAYTVGRYTVDREGALICPADETPEEADRLMAALKERGYEVCKEPTERGDIPEAITEPDDSNKLAIEVPDISLAAMSSLKKIIASKEVLFKKAFKAESLPIETTGNRLRFPWFTLTGVDGEADAYSRFVFALCEMAKSQKRVVAKQRDTDNDKFAMRVFLIRLGFVGAEFKTARKILLRNLTGNSSWKGGNPTRTNTDADENTVSGYEVGNTASAAEAAPYEGQ